MASLVLKLTADGNNKLRGMSTQDGMQMWSVYDFLTIACAKNDKGAYARKWFGDNVKSEESEYYDEFVDHLSSFQFPGATHNEF